MSVCLTQHCFCIHFFLRRKRSQKHVGLLKGQCPFATLWLGYTFGALPAVSWSTSILPRYRSQVATERVRTDLCPHPPFCCLVFLWLEKCKAAFEVGSMVHLAQNRVKLQFALPKQRFIFTESLLADLKWKLIRALERRLTDLSASFQQRSHPSSNTLLPVVFSTF